MNAQESFLIHYIGERNADILIYKVSAFHMATSGDNVDFLLQHNVNESNSAPHTISSLANVIGAIRENLAGFPSLHSDGLLSYAMKACIVHYIPRFQPRYMYTVPPTTYPTGRVDIWNSIGQPSSSFSRPGHVVGERGHPRDVVADNPMHEQSHQSLLGPSSPGLPKEAHPAQQSTKTSALRNSEEALLQLFFKNSGKSTSTSTAIAQAFDSIVIEVARYYQEAKKDASKPPGGSGFLRAKFPEASRSFCEENKSSINIVSGIIRLLGDKDCKRGLDMDSCISKDMRAAIERFRNKNMQTYSSGTDLAVPNPHPSHHPRGNQSIALTDDDWPSTWAELKRKGWLHQRIQGEQGFVYVCPSENNEPVHKKNYFTSKEEVMEHLKQQKREHEKLRPTNHRTPSPDSLEATAPASASASLHIPDDIRGRQWPFVSEYLLDIGWKQITGIGGLPCYLKPKGKTIDKGGKLGEDFYTLDGLKDFAKACGWIGEPDEDATTRAARASHNIKTNRYEDSSMRSRKKQSIASQRVGGKANKKGRQEKRTQSQVEKPPAKRAHSEDETDLKKQIARLKRANRTLESERAKLALENTDLKNTVRQIRSLVPSEEDLSEVSELAKNMFFAGIRNALPRE